MSAAASRVTRWVVATALLGLAGVLVVGALATPGSDLGNAQEAAGPKTAPPLVTRASAGHQVASVPAADRWTLVNFWASWCGPCRDEMPVLAQAQQTGVLDGVAVVGVDVRDRESAARDFLQSIAAPSMVAVADPEGRHATAWGVRGLPQTFLVDPAGRIVATRSGPVDAAWLEETVGTEVRS